jgi:hypothetical protein
MFPAHDVERYDVKKSSRVPRSPLTEIPRYMAHDPEQTDRHPKEEDVFKCPTASAKVTTCGVMNFPAHAPMKPSG